MENRSVKKFTILILLILFTAFLSGSLGLARFQITAISIFFVSVFATLLFWDFRVAIAFLGIAFLLMTKTTDLDNVIKFASLEAILFLVGMMVLVGFLKESGFLPG